jgi:hypothetical protein
MALTVRTAQDLVTAALEDLGRVNIGDSIEAGELHQAFYRLQDMIAEIGLQIAPNVVVESFSMIAGTSTYTIGESGAPTLNTVRPEEVISAYVRSSGVDSDVEIIGENAYAGITDKASPGIPLSLWVKYTSPNATFVLWPVPDSTDSLFFVSRKPLNEPAALGDNLVLITAIPRNLFNVLKLNLMVELSGKNADPALLARAQRALKGAVSLNMARQVEPVGLEWGRVRRGTIYNPIG